ncbi:MAG: DNRLRE domain-containing protein [Acidobacteriota bacterium]
MTLTAVADTTLRQQQTNQNRGTDELIRLGWAQGSRALVRFDQAAIAAAVGSGHLVSAQLELWVDATGESWGSGAQNVGTHRVTADWTEAGATWSCAIDSHPGDNHADCNLPWNGGSFLAATATVPHTKQTRGAVTFGVTADVAAFLSGTANRGWLLKKANESASGRIDYASREGTAASHAPRLMLVVETSGGDSTLPIVTITAPGSGALLPTTLPKVTASYSDAGSGINATSARLTVDGVDRTGGAVVTAAGLTWTPTSPVAEGAHTASVTVRDLAGNSASASASFSTDSLVPTLAIVSPPPGRTVGALPPSIAVEYADLGSGLDLATVSIKVDGAALSGCTVGASAASCQVPTLAPGEHTLAASVRDRASNPGSGGLSFDFVRDLTPPTIAIDVPADGAIGNGAAVLVSGTVADDSGAEIAVSVNGQPAPVAGGRFAVFVPLAEGDNELVAIATDVAGRQASATISAVLDTVAPTLAVDSPQSGATTNAAVARVSGTAGDTQALERVTVAGAVVAVSGGRFAADVPLAEGSNSIEVRAVDRAGNDRRLDVAVSRFSLPTVEVTAPADLSTVAATTLDVRGTTGQSGLIVAVNGRMAEVSGTSWVATDVPLIEGGNLLTAVAVAPSGRVGTATINVVRDLVAPRLSIDLPRAGSVLSSPTVTVVGLVNDIVAGTVNAGQASVTVNGRPAMVANRSFLAVGVPLVPGENTLTAVATDASGNVGQATTIVRLDTSAAPRIVAVAGDGQSGTIRSALPAPLTVALTDAAGLPVAGRQVLFKAVGSDGRLNGVGRQAAVLTGPDGRASATYTLGSRAGVGNQVVEAIAAGFVGPALFTESAEHGPASLIVVDAGDQQEGATGNLLPRPLVAAVTDAGFNRVPGVAVRFEVFNGGGRFASDQTAIQVTTDSDGRAIVPFRIDSAEGVANNVVEASIVELPSGPSTPIAGFVASGRTAGVADTTISGIVLDNSNQPVPGTTLRIMGSPLTTTANAQGVWKLTGVPVGLVKLIVDGSTTSRPGAWPDLEFVMTTIPGRDNTLGMPIFLLPIDLAQGVLIDETHGGRITLADVPGFALEVAPGSVTFPGGSRSGVVSVTSVHSDKVPMVPNFGQQPRLIVTIQPAGARFDPPARLTLPNVEGYAPGQVTEFYSFDHDLGHFVSIGPATVSDDGALIVSNPGVGIVKAGWHCGGNPGGSGTSHNCPECKKCVNGCCKPNDGPPCDDHNECTINDSCRGGSCKGDPVTVTEIKAKCVAAVNQPILLTAASNARDRVKWKAPGGTPATGMGGSLSVTYSTEGDFVVTAMCRESAKTKKVSTGPTCATIAGSLKELETEGSAGGNFGKVVHGTRVESKYKACVDGSNGYCYRLEEYLQEHSFKVDIRGRIDIKGADDPQVDPSTCEAIIADFTPDPSSLIDGQPVAHYRSYISRSIIEAHEQVHVADGTNLIAKIVFSKLTEFVSRTVTCKACKGPSDYEKAVFDLERARLFFERLTIEKEGAEARGYLAENALLGALTSAIRQRARSAPPTEGWPEECK